MLHILTTVNLVLPTLSKEILHRGHRTGEYKNWVENCMTGVQQQTKWSISKNQWIQRQGRGTYPKRAAKKKKEKRPQNKKL